MLRRLAPILVLLTACGPEDPSVDEAGTTADTDTADPTASEPTTTDTEGTDTDFFPGLCGPCHTLAEGDVSPSSRPQLDGILVAVDQLRDAIVTVRGEFRADLRALTDIYGLAPADPSPALVADLIAAIEADLAANLDEVRVHHVAARCSGNIDVAAAAQRACEAGSGCDVAVPAARPAVLCEGRCEGDCDAACSGDLSCVQPVAGAPCEGLCAGVCTLAGGDCTGLCFGDCAGTCLVTDSQGKCSGPCDGPCVGNCEPGEPTPCAGTCTGACLVEQGSAQCLGDGPCRGACNGECAGECAGHLTPPSSAADCAASADCNTQASLQGAASLRCTPPILDLHFLFRPGVNAEAQAQFIERQRVLKRRSLRILQGAARLRALLDGSVDGEFLWAAPPAAELTAVLQGIIGIGVDDALGIPEGRLPCVIPALQEAVGEVGEASVIAAATLEAQTMFVAFITGDL